MADDDKKEYPSFYAIIPAYVRYNKSLSPNAKLLFGEITALADKYGYCYASNKYLSNVFDVDKSSITHWIQQLIKTGCIKQEFIYAVDKPIITERRIYITIPMLPPPNNKEIPLKIEDEDDECSHQDSDFFDRDNSSAPDINNNIHQEMNNYAFESDTNKGGGEIFHQGGEKTHHGVVKNFNRGGEISPEIVLQANNTKVVVVDQSFQKTEKPPPETATTTPLGISEESVDHLKLHFAGLDKTLAFDEAFYPKILLFLAEHDLDFDYVSWIYDFCYQNNRKNRNLKNLSGYLFKILCESRYVEIYREASRPPPDPAVVSINCPVCGKVFDSTDLSCPECGFNKEFCFDKDKVKEAKILYSMAPDIKRAYEEEFGDFLDENSSMDFAELSIKAKTIKQKYGLL